MLNIVPKQQLESARIELAQALAGKSELIASRDAMEEQAREQAQRANALERAVQECCVELGLLQQEVGRQQDGYRQALEDAKQRAEHDRIRAEALEEELGRLRLMVDAARYALSTEAQHAEVVDTMTELSQEEERGAILSDKGGLYEA